MDEVKSGSVRKFVSMGVIGLVALVAFGAGLGSFYTIDEGQRGVVLTNGSFSYISNPGLNFKIPYVQSVIDISVRNEATRYENVLTYSFDQQTAGLTFTVNYTISPGEVEMIYRQFGSRETAVARILDTRVYQTVKTVFGQYTAAKSIQDRSKLNADINDAVKKAVQGSGIDVISVQLENIDFSDAYEQSVENRMLAEVEVQKLRQNSEREKVQAQITVTKANAARDAQIAEAEAKAKATRLQGEAEAAATKLRGEAEAYAIGVKGKALADNPTLVELTKAEKWNGNVPTTMVPNSAVPFVNMK